MLILPVPIRVIEIRPNPHTRQGFSAGQLLHYTLEHDPALPLGEAPASRERLVFAFSTADVVVFGARLAFLVELLRDHRLTAVWPLAERYSNLEPSQPFVSAIAIRLLGNKSDGAAGLARASAARAAGVPERSEGA